MLQKFNISGWKYDPKELYQDADDRDRTKKDTRFSTPFLGIMFIPNKRNSNLNYQLESRHLQMENLSTDKLHKSDRVGSLLKYLFQIHSP